MHEDTRDRIEIRDALGRYARAVDRAEYELLRTVFHADAYDDHGAYKGGVDGFILWLRERFSDDAPTQHFLGNSLVEFANPGLALVETYFIAARPAKGTEAGEGAGPYVMSWGRYVDRFERREGAWKVAHRRTVVDLRLQAAVNPFAGNEGSNRGRRDAGDALHVARAEIFGRA